MFHTLGKHAFTRCTQSRAFTVGTLCNRTVFVSLLISIKERAQFWVFQCCLAVFYYPRLCAEYKSWPCPSDSVRFNCSRRMQCSFSLFIMTTRQRDETVPNRRREMQAAAAANVEWKSQITMRDAGMSVHNANTASNTREPHMNTQV